MRIKWVGRRQRNLEKYNKTKLGLEIYGICPLTKYLKLRLSFNSHFLAMGGYGIIICGDYVHIVYK